jgi:Holliday junction resolvase
MDHQTSIQELRDLMKDLVQSQKENTILFRETDLKFKETDIQMKATDRKLNKTIYTFEDQWGRLIESLVEGGLVALMKSRGIDVHRTSTRVTGDYKGQQYEFDIIAHNGTEIVIVEVKSGLNVKKVKEFLEELSQVKIWLHEYKDYKVYGAVAFLKSNEESTKFAERQGLFVIKATGDSSRIINQEDFKARIW